MQKGADIILLALAGAMNASATLGAMLGSISLETNLLTYTATVASGRPSAPGTYYATCTVASVSASFDEMAQSNAFTYLAPGLQVLGTNGAVIAGGEGADSTKGTQFRPTLFGAVITNTFSITNVGNAMLTISSYTNTGADAAQFFISGVPSTIAAGGSSNFYVRFDASALGSHACTVTFVSDATNNPYVLNLAGAAVKSNRTITSSSIAPKKPGSPSGLRLRPVQVFR